MLVPGGEIFTNLATGVIDAAEWVGSYHDYVMGFHKAANFPIILAGTNQAQPLELLINQKLGTNTKNLKGSFRPQLQS